MCLTPIRLRTNSKYISVNGYRRFSMDVPCGKCAECQQMKKNEWYVRNYFEAQSTWLKGGYVLFDTLTYSDEYLPSVKKTVIESKRQEILDSLPDFARKDSSYNKYDFLVLLDMCKGATFGEIRSLNDALNKNDYSCFDYHGVQNFLKRLRINIQRGILEPEYNKLKELKKKKKELLIIRKDMVKKYPLRKKVDKIKNFAIRDAFDKEIFYISEEIKKLKEFFKKRNSFEIRYFLCSEYGHDDVYVDFRGRSRRGTCRPHYHVLFYITDPSLDPITFSRYISDAWYLGRTDGYDYRGRSYVLNNTFGPKYIKDPNRLTGVQYYVSKYVCKDYDFSESVDIRISHVARDVFHYNMGSNDYSLKRRELHGFMDQFHRQSLGFGLTALCSEDILKSIWETGKIVLPDKAKVSKSFSVPMYYVRKLFQVCDRDSEGTYHWNWTATGCKWKSSCIERSVSVLSQKMRDWYSNLDVYTSEGSHYRKKVDSILDGRSFDDYAKYIVYYRHRLYDGDVPTVSEVLERSLMPCSENGSNVAHKFPDGYYFDDSSGDRFYISVQEMYDNCVMDDRVLPEFRGFDLLYSLYCASMRKWNDHKQKTYKEKLDEQKAFKKLGLKTKRI